MADKFMYIPKVNKQNYPFNWLQLVVETFRHSLNKLSNKNSIEKPKVVMSTNKKTFI